MENIQLLQSGKTFPEHSAATMEKTSGACLKNLRKSPGEIQFLDLRIENGNGLVKSWETVIPSHGERWTRNIGESPNVARESTLSQILQVNVPEKYYLSPKACLGILRRASARGKELPELLRKALERQAASA